MPQKITKNKSLHAKRLGVVRPGEHTTQALPAGPVDFVNSMVVYSVDSNSSPVAESSQELESCEICEVLFTQDKGYDIVVPNTVNFFNTNAIVDTAAQVTVVNSQVAQEAGLSLKGAEKVSLRGVGENSRLEALLVKGVRLFVGDKVYPWDIYVAAITEDRKSVV